LTEGRPLCRSFWRRKESNKVVTLIEQGGNKRQSIVTMDCGGRVDDVVRRADAELMARFHEDLNGDLRPWARTSCDGFVKKEKKRAIAVKRLKAEKESFKPQQKSPEEAKSHCARSGEGKEAFVKESLLLPAGRCKKRVLRFLHLLQLQ
jgi:hypothetical protein